jgi:hypothetical protein
MSDTIDQAKLDAALTAIRGYIERGDYSKAYQGCREVLSVDPQNQLALQIKAEIEQRELIMKSGAATGVSTRALKCPACNASLNILREDSETITCATCGAVLDLDSEEVQILEKLNNKKFPPGSFIRLGKTGMLFGSKYQVIGRLCYQSSIREWDPEDSCYYTDRWAFDEWVLVGENKEYAYLSEDAEGYSISFPFTPTNPGLPESQQTSMTLFKDRPMQLIQEMGQANVEYFEGEFTWRPKVGDKKKWAEYKDDQFYSVEWRIDEQGNPLEVEFFKSQPITKLDLARAFNETAIIEEERRKEEAAKQYKWWSWGFVGAGVLCMLLMLVSCGSSGKSIASYSVNLANIANSSTIRGPFQMNKKGKLYSINLNSSIPNNSNAWFGVELLDSEQQPVNAVEGDFWHESGYDSDGHWSESDTSQERIFRLENPGTFYVRIHGEPGNTSNATLNLKILEGVGVQRYYLLAMFLCFGFAVAIRKYKTLNPAYIVVGLLVIGFLILSAMGDDD